jgi:methionine-rich copper-binding protein CopC
MTTGIDGKPFGLKEIVVVSYDGVTAISLPAALELEFEETVVSGEFFGNDELQGLVTQPLGVKGKFKSGGIPLNAYALMTGHTYGVSGSTPNEVATLQGNSPTFPYFKVYGKSLGDVGDDIHVKLMKIKLTGSPKGSFKRGEFFMLEAEFQGVKVSGKAYDLVANETTTALPGATASAPAFTLSSSPADAAVGVVISANVVLTFSNALRVGAEDAIMLTTAAGVPVAVARTIDAARKVVTLDPTSNMSALTAHLIIVPGVVDVFGQALANTVRDFTTA